MKHWKLFKSLIRISLQDHLTYKGMLAVWMFDIFFLPLTLLFIWRTIALESANINSQLTTITNYYLLLPIIVLYTSAWHGTYLARTIRLGHLSKNLTKPLPVLLQFFASNISSKVIKSFFLLPMVMVAISIFSISLSLTLSQVIFFTISLTLTWILTLFRDNIMGLLAFWFDETSAFSEFVIISEFTLGGRIIPLFFFPPFIKTLSAFLPFRYFTSFPLEIITGTLTNHELILGFAFQLFWTLLFILTTHLLWKHGVRRYSAFGG